VEWVVERLMLLVVPVDVPMELQEHPHLDKGVVAHLNF
jgi:hypothetical protein